MTAAAPLGPVQRAALEALAETEDGLTITAPAAVLGVSRTAADQSVRTLKNRGFVRVATYKRIKGKAAAVYVISTAGLAALEAAKEAA